MELEEIRLHGRGGQGAVSLSQLIADAAVREGKFARAFPWYGAARRGAPVMAFVAIGSKESITRSQIRNPKYVIVLDPALHKVVATVTQGIKEGGIYIQNSSKDLKTLLNELNLETKLSKIGTIDATKIATDITGRSIPNIVMFGAFIKATGLVSLETAAEVVKDRFPRQADKNVECLKAGYEKVNIEVLR